MKNIIVKCLCLTVMLLAMQGMMTPTWTIAEEKTPTKLTFVYARPKDDPQTQWLILIYTEALKRMGIEFVFMDVPAKRASFYSDAGDVDGELNRVASYNEKWKNVVRVGEHNMIAMFSAFATDPAISLDGWESLRNTEYRVEYRRGVRKSEENLPRVVPSERLSEIGTVEQAVMKLFAGRTDVFVEAEGPVMTYLGTQAFQEVKQEMGQGKMIHKVGTMEKVFGHAWLYKTHADLAPRLAGILREMKAERLFEAYRDQVGILPAELTW